MSALDDLITSETRKPTFAAAHTFARYLAERIGPSTAAVLFYGSCLRHATDEGLLLDFYVLVDSMNAAIRNPVSATLGSMLSPNVYYFEMPFEGRTVRAKVAVMSMSRFLHDTSPRCFASSVWARFSQPTLILYARNDVIRARAQSALAQAVTTMITTVLPLMPQQFTARALWVKALSLTYGAELRPESDAKAAQLVDADLARVEAVTACVLGTPRGDGTYTNTNSHEAATAARAWTLRRWQGKSLNILRLIKAAFTFQGGLDYAVWKIERHSGVKIAVTDADRRWPLLAGLRLLPQLLKRGGVR